MRVGPDSVVRTGPMRAGPGWPASWMRQDSSWSWSVEVVVAVVVVIQANHVGCSNDLPPTPLSELPAPSLPPGCHQHDHGGCSRHHEAGHPDTVVLPARRRRMAAAARMGRDPEIQLLSRSFPARSAEPFPPEVAQGEAGEVAAAIASLLDIEMGDPALAAGVLAAIGRVGAMSTGLIRHCRRQAGSAGSPAPGPSRVQRPPDTRPRHYRISRFERVISGPLRAILGVLRDSVATLRRSRFIGLFWRVRPSLQHPFSALFVRPNTTGRATGLPAASPPPTPTAEP